MKKLFLIIILIFVCGTCYSQTIQYKLFKGGKMRLTDSLNVIYPYSYFGRGDSAIQIYRVGSTDAIKWRINTTDIMKYDRNSGEYFQFLKPINLTGDLTITGNVSINGDSKGDVLDLDTSLILFTNRVKNVSSNIFLNATTDADTMIVNHLTIDNRLTSNGITTTNGLDVVGDVDVLGEVTTADLVVSATADFNGATISNLSGYLISEYYSNAATSPTSGQTLYGGGVSSLSLQLSITPEQKTFSYSGSIVGFCLNVYATTAGTGDADDTTGIFLRINNTTDYYIGKLNFNAGTTLFTLSNTSLNIPITAADKVSVKWVCPTWTSAPTGLYSYGNIYFKK